VRFSTHGGIRFQHLLTHGRGGSPSKESHTRKRKRWREGRKGAAGVGLSILICVVKEGDITLSLDKRGPPVQDRRAQKETFETLPENQKLLQKRVPAFSVDTLAK